MVGAPRHSKAATGEEPERKQRTGLSVAAAAGMESGI